MKEKIYEVEFEQLKEADNIETLDNKKEILDASLQIVAQIGTCTKSVKEILNLQKGDVIILDKLIEGNIDINVNGEKIATGESIVLNDKLALRICKI